MLCRKILYNAVISTYINVYSIKLMIVISLIYILELSNQIYRVSHTINLSSNLIAEQSIKTLYKNVC